MDVLDHGFIRVVDYMGDEAAIVQAARVSYGKGTTTPSSDRGLLRYLLRHWHTTPFEMCEIKLHVKLPVFVARQWIRHRTANVNEYSARYSILESEFHVPDLDDILPQSTDNKQGRGGAWPDDRIPGKMQRLIEEAGESASAAYKALLTGWPWLSEDREWIGPATMKAAQPHDEEHGISRELARMVMPLNTYTEWYWKVDLHNLLHFLRLRADPHAQKEIRVYADMMLGIVETWMPNVFEAFVDYRLEAETFSRQEMEALRTYLGDLRTTLSDDDVLIDIPPPDDTAFSGRERREFWRKLRIEG